VLLTKQCNLLLLLLLLQCLRHESGRAPHMAGPALKGTAEVSLSALLRSHDLYHPVRHTEAGKEATK
jgi:hypothetical protein